MTKQYRQKPVVIEAIRYTYVDELPDDFRDAVILDGEGQTWVNTLEGSVLLVDNGSYIVRGVRGEFYPVRGDIFEETYELVEDAKNGKATETGSEDTGTVTNTGGAQGDSGVEVGGGIPWTRQNSWDG